LERNRERPDDYEFAGKYEFSRHMTKFLRPIGLKLPAYDARKGRRTGKKKRKKSKESPVKKYSLQRSFDIKLNVNS